MTGFALTLIRDRPGQDLHWQVKMGDLTVATILHATGGQADPRWTWTVNHFDPPWVLSGTEPTLDEAKVAVRAGLQRWVDEVAWQPVTTEPWERPPGMNPAELMKCGRTTIGVIEHLTQGFRASGLWTWRVVAVYGAAYYGNGASRAEVLPAAIATWQALLRRMGLEVHSLDG